MNVVLTTPPAAEPVALSQAKLHLRVDEDEDDALIEALILVAREQVEFLTGQRLITQTWAVTAEAAGEVSLYGLTPIQNVTSEDTSFSVNGELPPTLTVDSAGTLILTCGFGDPSAVPASLRQWMLLRIGALYEQRESLVLGAGLIQAPHSFADALLDPYTTPRT